MSAFAKLFTVLAVISLLGCLFSYVQDKDLAFAFFWLSASLSAATLTVVRRWRI